MESGSKKNYDSVTVSDIVEPGFKEPYVGMRPYTEDEKALFYGRDDVALRLRNKIYSNRLTILYASSGVGKTSILQTLVEPELRDLNAHVVHFDRWSGEEPLTVLIHAIQKSIQGESIEMDSDGEESLDTLTQAINKQLEKPLVLILDQFEEFLRKHGQRMDPIRSELAKLIRNNSIQVHIVLSLRQEFLTGLEPFREVILNLFQSTYQLKDLNEKEIRDAITLPVEQFGLTYEDALIDKLIEDLGVNKTAEKIHGRKGNVDLPPLQQVLLELWRFAKSGSQTVITLSLYKQLGGAQKILDDYINKVMPKRWLNKLFIARLMRALAPPSGLKQSFTPTDLCFAVGMSDEKSTRVKDELEHLTDQKILRTRKFSTSDEISYELQHDAFVEIISRWRTVVFKNFRRLKQLSIGAAILAIVMLIPLAKWIIDERDIHMNTDGLLARYADNVTLSHESGLYSRIEHATDYILSRKDGEQYFEKLRSLLDNNNFNIKDSYGLNLEGLNNIIPTDNKWPVTLKYSSSRPLNKSIFNYKWKEVANYFAKKRGIPLPTRLHLQTEDFLDTERIKLSVHKHASKKSKYFWMRYYKKEIEDNSIDLIMLSNENFAYISEKDLPAKTKRFFNYFRQKNQNNRDRQVWKQLPSAPPLGPWWIVPRWSLPVWKVSGKKAIDGSAFLASLLAMEIKKSPEFLLHPAATELILNKVSKKFPTTVKEAKKARGKKLHKDFVEVIRNESSLLHLPLILDALAHYPSKTSKDAVQQVLLDINGPVINNNLKLHGVWKRKSSTSKIKDVDISPYREVETILPDYESPIRIYFGEKIAEHFDFEDGKSSRLKEAMLKLEDNIIKKFGVGLPSVSYKFLKNGKETDDYSFRIEVLNKTGKYDEVKTHKTNPDNAMQDVLNEFKKRAYEYRVFWLTAESTNRLLRNVPYKLQKWMKKHYSITDIKLIFRAILNPTLSEIVKPVNGEENNHNIPTENTLYHLGWMLKTMPFWIEVDGKLSLEELVSNFRKLQKLRYEGLQEDTIKISDDISKGIGLLQNSKYDEAGKYFITALKHHKEHAIESFLIKYVDKFEEKLEGRLLKLCKRPTAARLKRNDRVILKDYISRNKGFPSEKKRKMKLCLLKNYPSAYKKDSYSLIKDLSESYSNPAKWKSEEAIWFSKKLFENYDPVTDTEKDKLLVKNFFESSYYKLKGKSAFRRFQRLSDKCYKSDRANWCKSWLNDLAAKSKNYDIKLRLAYELSKSEKIQELEYSLELVEAGIKLIDEAEVKPRDKSIYQEYIKLIRAISLYHLEMQKSSQDFNQSEKILLKLVKSVKSKVISRYAYYEILNIKKHKGEYAEAIILAESALGKWPKDIKLNYFYLISNILLGKNKKAIEIADDITDKIGVNPRTLYVATLGKMLTDAGGWHLMGQRFIATDHVNANYIAMMMYANSVGKEKYKAAELLKNKWAEINTEDWRRLLAERLKAGDNKVWQEMLVGYYQNEVTADEIFKSLSSDVEFDKSNFKYTDYTRKALLTEAYFYDAMLKQAHNDIKGMKKRLRQVIDVNYKQYSEYTFSKTLLASLNNNQDK